MSEWLPQTGRLLTRQQRLDVIEILNRWQGFNEVLRGSLDDASERACRVMTTADMATVLLFASCDAAHQARPRAVPLRAVPIVQTRMQESAAQLSVPNSHRPELAPLLDATDHAFDFVTGLPTRGPGYSPSELGLLVVGSIIESAL